MSYETFKGCIPDGLLVRHSCDVGMCVNPDHLSVGTHADNKSDSVTRNRHAKGVRIARAVLTDGDVREIRRMAASNRSALRIAAHLGVSRGAVQPVMSGRTWRHVT